MADVPVRDNRVRVPTGGVYVTVMDTGGAEASTSGRTAAPISPGSTLTVTSPAAAGCGRLIVATNTLGVRAAAPPRGH